ncbi:MAG: glycosyltransferase, partial [Burkholderiaceae bacterium]
MERAEITGAATRRQRISVVVLTHGRAAELARTLRQLRALPERPPLIVVDNASPDDTAAMVARDFPEAVLVRAPRNLGAAGRNLGAAAARTPYVAFCDDDPWWAPGSLAAAADLLDRHRSVA